MGYRNASQGDGLKSTIYAYHFFSNNLCVYFYSSGTNLFCKYYTHTYGYQNRPRKYYVYTKYIQYDVNDNARKRTDEDIYI